MSVKQFGLLKKEKLCSVTAIDTLFGPGGAEFSTLAYPLRAMGRNNPRRSSDAQVTFLISVPKKRLRHAVDRVAMRRRIREAYRLNRHLCILPEDSRIDLAFVYVADKLKSYAAVERAVKRILSALSAKYKEKVANTSPES